MNKSFEIFGSVLKMYVSKFTGREIKPANYIVEMLCERKADKEHRTLKGTFWREDYWKTFYAQQIVAVNGLLKTYPHTVIISALKRKETNWVYSLRSPQLVPILGDELKKHKQVEKIEKDKKEQQSQKIDETINLDKPAQPEVRKTTNNKSSVFNKLKGL